MYYIVRILAFLLCVIATLIAYMLLHKRAIKKRTPDFHEKYKTNKKFKRNIILKNLCVYIIFAIFILLSTYPFECYFVTFNTVEESLSYKGIELVNANIYESDKTVFIADEDTSKLYSITKIGDKFGVVDFQSENCNYYEPKSANSIIREPTYAKYNKATGETFYYIRVQSQANQSYENVLLDNCKMTLATIGNSYNILTESYDKYPIYFYIDNNTPKDTFQFDVIDYSTTLKRS